MRPNAMGTTAAIVAAVVCAAIGQSAPAAGAIHLGSKGDDRITGSRHNDVIHGRSGNDRLHGGRGHDKLTGGSGRDTIVGGPGNDKLLGGSGRDLLRGGPGKDTLIGGAGADTIVCGPGRDTVYADRTDTLKGCAGDTIFRGTNSLTTPYNASINSPARLQWNSNFGYCGETSFIDAGMMLGQYSSQWTVRDLVRGSWQQTSPHSQLLLGSAPDGKALTAGSAMRLDVEVLNTTTQSTQSFLAWVKSQVVAGNAVIIGVYNNVNILGEGGSGDGLYDHIVPVVGVGSQQPLTGKNASTYFASDTITISDNGLFTPGAPNVPGNTSNNASGSGLYTYQMGKFAKTRSQANQGWSVADLYSIKNSAPNFAAVVTGVVDTTAGGPVSIPISLTSSLNNEGFQNSATLASAPAALPMSLTARFTVPDQSKAYRVYRYTSFDSVPTQDFNANAADATQSWTVEPHSGSTWTHTFNTTTGSTQVFRVVPTDAP